MTIGECPSQKVVSEFEGRQHYCGIVRWGTTLLQEREGWRSGVDALPSKKT
jgi:hypothetical protein